MASAVARSVGEGGCGSWPTPVACRPIYILFGSCLGYLALCWPVVISSEPRRIELRLLPSFSSSPSTSSSLLSPFSLLTQHNLNQQAEPDLGLHQDAVDKPPCGAPAIWVGRCCWPECSTRGKTPCRVRRQESETGIRASLRGGLLGDRRPWSQDPQVSQRKHHK